MLPGKTRLAFAAVQEQAPQLHEMAQTSPLARLQKIKWNFAPLPKLPPLPGFVTRDARSAAAVDTIEAGTMTPRRRAIPLPHPGGRDRLKPSASVAADAVLATLNNEEEDDGDIINLQLQRRRTPRPGSGADAAFIDETDPEPAEAAVIPPPAPKPGPTPSAPPASAPPIIDRRTGTRAAPAPRPLPRAAPTPSTTRSERGRPRH